MKRTIIFIAPVVAGLGLLAAGCAQKHSAEWKSIKNPEVTAQLKSFVAEKQAQAKADGSDAYPDFKKYFAAAEKGDWLAVSNAFEDFRKHAGQYEHSGKTDERLRGSKWAAVVETWGALYYFGAVDEKYSAAFGNDIIASIPAGGIYFGGTDPGRFLITALQKSQVAGDPFFTLTQNALADGSYLDYARGIYGDKIYIPTAEDSHRCFQEYTQEVTKRQQNGKLKPGEDVYIDNGRMQISGHVAVMEINARLAKIVFDKNPAHEFYVEESFPLDWMYPYLEPHDLIMKINRQPLTTLSAEKIKQDRDYWAQYVTPMIGDWLNKDTPVEAVTAFAEKVYAQQDSNGFKGDPRFIQSPDTQKMFSKLRSSIGGLYAWRAQQTVDASEKQRLNDEADFAFRQAFALCPYSPEGLFRYVNFLLSENRGTDALLVARTAADMPSMKGRDGEQVRSLINQLKQFQPVK
jgi:hypothetical protein